MGDFNLRKWREFIISEDINEEEKMVINIEDIIVGDEVLTTKGYRKVRAVFNQGNQEICEIPTTTGSFKCTKNHKMACYNEETNNYYRKQADELEIGDKLK